MLRNSKLKSSRNSFSFANEAYRSFRKKNYSNAVIILEKGYASGETNSYSLFLLAVSLIYSNNFSRAGIILEQIQRLDPLYEPFLQLKAFLSLKSAISREEAMHVYVSSLEKIPADRMLRKALRILEESKNFSVFQKNVKLHELVEIPSPAKIRMVRKISAAGKAQFPRSRSNRLFLIIFVSALSVSAIIVGLSPLYKTDLLNRISSGKREVTSSGIAEKVDMVDIGGAGYGVIDRINTEKKPEFYASGDLVVSDFNDARRLLKKGEFNRGVIILNKIINSNASYMIKEKCEFLIKYVMDSDERQYEEIEVSKLNEKPYLYRGTSLKLTGRVANIKQEKGGKSFTLMVGYDGNNFKGITLVFDPKNTSINNSEIVTVNGLYITGMGKSNIPYISGENISKSQ